MKITNKMHYIDYFIIPSRLYTFRATFSPTIRSTWLYSQYQVVFTQVAAETDDLWQISLIQKIWVNFLTHSSHTWLTPLHIGIQLWGSGSSYSWLKLYVRFFTLPCFSWQTITTLIIYHFHFWFLCYIFSLSTAIGKNEFLQYEPEKIHKIS